MDFIFLLPSMDSALSLTNVYKKPSKCYFKIYFQVFAVVNMTAFYTIVHVQSMPAVMYTFVSLMSVPTLSPQANKGYFLQPQWL